MLYPKIKLDIILSYILHNNVSTQPLTEDDATALGRIFLAENIKAISQTSLGDTLAKLYRFKSKNVSKVTSEEFLALLGELEITIGQHKDYGESQSFKIITKIRDKILRSSN